MQSRRSFIKLCGALSSAGMLCLTGSAGMLGLTSSMLGLSGCADRNQDLQASDTKGASNTSNASNAISPDISANITTLTIGFDQAYPPYGFLDNDGKLTGFDLDLAKLVCDCCGWDLILEPIDWDAKNMLLTSGAITCIWNGFTLEGREDDYTFSSPYMLNGQVIVVKAGSGITALADLAAKSVITQTDSAAEEVLKGDKAPLASSFMSLETIGDYNTAFMQLESGAVDAVACDLSIAQYQLAAKPQAFVQIDEALSTEHYAIAFKKGSVQLANKVTETLKTLDADGAVQELCNKYASYGISYDNWILT